MRGMATKEEIARYGWVRSAVLGAVLLVLGVVIGGPTGLLLGVMGVGVLVYSLFKRDRDRRAIQQAATFARAVSEAGTPPADA